MYIVKIDIKPVSDTYGEYHTIYNPSEEGQKQNLIILNTSLSMGVNKAGDFKFVVPVINPLYNELHLLSTNVVVEQDDKVIWIGRIYSIELDYNKNKTVVCEGTMSYLSDVLVDPVAYEQSIPMYDHLYNIFHNYNQKCSPKRQIEVSVDNNAIKTELNYRNLSISLERRTIYEEMLECLKDISCSIVVDYDNGYTNPVMHICTLPTKYSSQRITFGENMLDYTEEITGDTIFTRLYPVGSENITLDIQSGMEPYIESGLLISKYGIIEKKIIYDNIAKKEDETDYSGVLSRLENAAQQDLNVVVYDEIKTVNISAVDFHLLNPNIDAIVVGYGYSVIPPYGIQSGTYVCTAITINIQEPSNSQYTFERLDTFKSPDYAQLSYLIEQSKYKKPMPESVPVKITRDGPNKVIEDHGTYEVIIEADGEGDERYNFTRKIVGKS